MELNKIYFRIFRIFYDLLRIYQFLADLKNKRKVNWRFYIRNLRKKFYSFFFFHHTDSGLIGPTDGGRGDRRER